LSIYFKSAIIVKMTFQTLCSGSKGNCALLTSENTVVLIDLGISLQALEKALEERKIKAEKIDGVFITHEHSDHISGAEAFSKKYRKPIFVHKNGFLETAKKLYWSNHYLTHFDGGFDFKNLHVSTYRCSHDSAYCCGYKFSDGKTGIATATDLGYADNTFMDFVSGCKLVLLESNHDEDMLKNGPYPPILKRRVGGSRGHLSNRQAAELVVKMHSVGVKRVLLGHLSQNNNTPELAFYTTVQKLKENGIVESVDITVDMVTQDSKSEVYRV